MTLAGTNLYWIDPNGDPDATAIFRIAKTGGTITKIYSGFASGQPVVDGSGIATDGSKLYTADEVQGQAHSMNLDGSSITFLGSRYGGFFDLEHHNAIAQDGSTLYFADDGSRASSGIPPQIVSLPKTGGGLFTTLASGPPLVSPQGLAVAQGMVFVVDPGAGNTIWVLPVAGGAPQKLVSGAPFVDIRAIASYGTNLFVCDDGNSGTNSGPGKLYRVSIPSQTLISSGQLSDPAAITGDNTNLYVSDGPSVFSVPVAGGPAAAVFTNGTPCCIPGITLSGSDLYWIDPNGDPDATAIFHVSTSGGAITKIYSGFATGQPVVDGIDITTDGLRLYTADAVQGRVDSMNFDGSNILPLGSRYGGFFDLEHRNSIAQNGPDLFIADDGSRAASGIPPQVVHIGKTGGAFTTLHSGAPFISPNSIAVAGTNLYIADPGATNAIWRMPLTGGTPVRIAYGSPFIGIYGITYANGSLYVTDTGNTSSNSAPGAIYRLDVPIFLAGPPLSQSVASGGNVIFSVTAGGTGPFAYQWQFNGVNISGANGSILNLTNVSPLSAGTYTVIISSATGTITASATLTVIDLKMYAGITLGGPAGSQYRIEYTDDLSNGSWQTLTNLTLTVSPGFFVDKNSPQHPTRFYRAVPGP
jgi:hypothetical protein